jgi:hypothetical protein
MSSSLIFDLNFLYYRLVELFIVEICITEPEQEGAEAPLAPASTLIFNIRKMVKIALI